MKLQTRDLKKAEEHTQANADSSGEPRWLFMYNSAFWSGFLEWLEKCALARGYISAEDFDLLRLCDDPDTVVEMVEAWYKKQEIVGRKAVPLDPRSMVI